MWTQDMFDFVSDFRNFITSERTVNIASEHSCGFTTTPGHNPGPLYFNSLLSRVLLRNNFRSPYCAPELECIDAYFFLKMFRSEIKMCVTVMPGYVSF